MVFFDGAEERHLAGRNVGDEQAVFAFRTHRVPQAVADHESLAVFGELHALRERYCRRLVRRDRIEITIDETFETRAVARVCGCCRLCVSGRADSQQSHERENSL